jgi:GNAT superfamily N-acetyltransferase
VDRARPATDADLDELAGLWARALAELDGQRGGWALAGRLHRADLPGFLHDALGQSDRLLIVGLAGGVASGLASLRAVRRRREPLGELELIYVDPAARQSGVASAMLEVAVARCREWGMHGLDAPALPGNRAAKSFFETQGMQARLLIMHRPLETGGG